MLNDPTLYKIQNEEVYNKAFERMKKTYRCPVCDQCDTTKEKMKRHIKEHNPWEIVDTLNLRCDVII